MTMLFTMIAGAVGLLLLVAVMRAKSADRTRSDGDSGNAGA